jgi:hypothetical protein
MNRDLFAGRYELLHEAQAGGGGRLFEARDAQTGEFVAVKVFHRQLDSRAAECRDLENVFTAAKACTHPKIVRFHYLSIEDGYLVREWIHGFGIVRLLRRRRELPAPELVALFEGLPEAIDAAVAARMPPTGDLLSRVFVGWERQVTYEELDQLLGQPVSKWRGFSLKLNPLSLLHVLPADDAGQSTMVNVRLTSGPVLAPPVAFAEMVYELLGAPRRIGSSRRFVPLKALNETGNQVLRRAIEGPAKPPSCAAFWQELIHEIDLRRSTNIPAPEASQPAPPPPSMNAPAPAPPPIPAKPPKAGKSAAALPPPLPIAQEPAKPSVQPPVLQPIRNLTIPEGFFGCAQTGTILRLTAPDVTVTPIHLISRPLFRIGRSLYHADLITRVLPETPENAKLSNELGRVHVIAEMAGATLSLRDGNGEQPSVNGAIYRDIKLAHNRPTALDRPGELALYRNYYLDVMPMLTTADRGCVITNENDWRGPNDPDPPVKGAVGFVAKRGQRLLRQAAWLFTRLDFSVSPSGEISWCEAGSGASQGTFLRHRGQFWIANFSLPAGNLVVGNEDIPPGGVVPIIAGHAVQLGARNYLAEVQ